MSKLEGYYAGRPATGEGYRLHIGGETWTWKKSKFLTNKFKFVPVGQTFTIEGSIEDNEKGGQTLNVDWDTFTFGEMKEDVEAHYIITDAQGKKARTIKQSYNKVDEENFNNLTLNEIRSHLLCVGNKSQQAALIARVMAALSY